MSVRAYAAMAAGQPLKSFLFEPKELDVEEIQIRVSHCGICHSDIHLVDNDWDITNFPFVPGHEIIGMVTKIGSGVKNFEPGQRVGVGWQASCCQVCEWCISGQENICAENKGTCVDRFGGFTEYLHVDNHFAFLIPDELDSAATAPLMCGGITVYSPLSRFVRPAMSVGVIGMGGLGHLAVQFARAMGCKVVVFSTSESKREDALELGAHRFIVSTDADQMRGARNSVDFLLSTVTVDLDWAAYLKLLRPNGQLCFVGASPGNINIPIGSLLGKQKAIMGSAIGGRPAIQEMLAFAVRHKIGAKAEVVSLDDVNKAIKKIRDNKARYRMVLECYKE